MKANLEQFCAVRSATLAMLQELSQEQLNYVPEPGEWSVAEVADHLILSEQALRGDIAILIERTKTGQTPYLYRSFTEFNARPALIPEFALRLLEVPLYFLNVFPVASIRDYVVRNVPVRALAPDVTLPRQGRAKAELCEDLRSTLHETEALFVANPALDYDRMRHQHPLFGIQTAPQLLRTLWLHEQAHQDQIKNVLVSPRFPQTA